MVLEHSNHCGGGVPQKRLGTLVRRTVLTGPCLGVARADGAAVLRLTRPFSTRGTWSDVAGKRVASELRHKAAKSLRMLSIVQASRSHLTSRPGGLATCMFRKLRMRALDRELHFSHAHCPR